MKLHFEPDLDYQHTAIESVCDLFRGQETCRTEFTVTRDATAAQYTLAFHQSDLGIGNRLHLLDDEILANLDDIQIRNGLRPSALAGLRRLHSGDGDGHGQDLRVPAHHLRVEPPLRLHQVRDCGAVCRDQGGRVQDPPDHRGALPFPLRQRAL